MSNVVFDASIVLAAVKEEPGYEMIFAYDAPLISAVNFAEVHTRLVDRGLNRHEAEESLALFDLTVVDFTAELAIASAELRAATRSHGLSLGDRACLALAASRQAIALTTDRAWQELDLPVQIEMAR